MKGSSATVSIGVVRSLFDAAIAFGADISQLSASYAVPPAVLADVDGRVPVAVLVRLWNEIPARCPVPNFGLWLGERTARAASQSFIGHLLQRSANVGDAMRRIIRLERVLHDIHPSTLVESEDGIRVLHEGSRAPVPTPAVVVEFGLAYVLVLERLATGVELVPRRVAFEHALVGDEAPYRALFRSRVDFGATASFLEIDHAVAAIPHISANASLLELLESHARSIVERLPRERAFVEQARRHVLDALLAPGDASLDDLARRMGLGARTMQRRLREEGTSHKALLDDVRRAVAERWLADRAKGIGEIAFALGFSEQASFHRAFVRWTGATPGAFRRARE